MRLAYLALPRLRRGVFTTILSPIVLVIEISFDIMHIYLHIYYTEKAYLEPERLFTKTLIIFLMYDLCINFTFVVC